MSKALTYVELDLDYCSLRYGTTTGAGTCPAVLGVDSAIKCFNTLSTCAVRPSFLNAPVTLRYTMPADYLPADIEALSDLASIDYSPAVISLGEDLGMRASLTASFEDHAHSDTGAGGDPYLSDRPYDPFKQGTYWGKFRARQSFVRGRALRWKQGTLGQSIDDMDTRHFVMDSFTGPTLDGQFSITAKDVLKLLDGDRSQAPLLSQGQLNADIIATDFLVTLTPTGVATSDYPASGYLAIGGSEVVAFGRDTSVGNDANTKLLLHFDGADAATSFTDSSGSARTGTAVGNAQLDTAKFLFGTASGLFDGNGDYVTFPDSADWTFSGDFTFDMWVQFNSLATAQTLFCHQTDANNQYRLKVSTAGALTFEVINASAVTATLSTAIAAVATGAWYHLAVVRHGTAWVIYVNGASAATLTSSATLPNYTSTFRVGNDATGTTGGLNGWLDEFRVSAVARWTAAFAPPVAPYASSADTVYITRAQFNTVAVAHNAGDRCQLCLYYHAQDPADVIADLCATYAGIDSGHIPITAWKAETAAFYRRVVTALICEPTGCDTLVSELIQQCGLAVWWDDIGEQVRLQVLRAISTTAKAYNDDNVLQATLVPSEQPDKRVSQVWTYFGQFNPLKGLNQIDNFRSTAITVNLQAETDYGAPAIKTIYSRWIPFGGLTIAERINDIQLGRYQTAPRLFTFETARRGGDTPMLGDGARLSGAPMQDATGAREEVPVQVTSVRPRGDAFEVTAEEMLFVDLDDTDLTQHPIIIDSNVQNINLRTLHDELYPTAVSGDTVTCTINSGVIVSSASASSPAFDVGSFATGVIVKLNVLGRIAGAGGPGGVGANSGGSPAATAGTKGGTALKTTIAITVDVSVGDGEIWAGGGGGGGGQLLHGTGGPFAGGGGGGGGGNVPASGGNIGTGNTGFSTAGSPGTDIAGGLGGVAYAPGPTAPAGNGGVPGSAGTVGSGGLGTPGAAGAAGNSIDGISHITLTGTGDIRGPQIN